MQDSVRTITQDFAEQLRPQSLIVSVLGAFIRDLGGWIAVADLVRLLDDVGVDEPAVRSSLSRLKRRGFVVGDRRGKAAGYRLSEDAQRLLAIGDRRIYDTSFREGDAAWIVAVFSVPESRRHQRYVLRSRLARLGFGNAAAGVWIAPAHVEADVRGMLEWLELTDYVNLFRAEYAGFETLREAVRSWWDLDGLESRCENFIGLYEPVLRAWKRRRPEAEAAFTDYIRALTHWRRLAFLDPGLPESVLPPSWAGHRALVLFGALRDRLAEPAGQHVVDVIRMSN
jgi:phenylacetic acid degradation operon negative regulatory protein